MDLRYIETRRKPVGYMHPARQELIVSLDQQTPQRPKLTVVSA